MEQDDKEGEIPVVGERMEQFAARAESSFLGLKL